MRDLAPDIVRQRLLVEGYFTADVDEPFIRACLLDLAAALHLRTYGEAVVFAPGGRGSDRNEGYDAFVPLIDSGISLYVWSAAHFLSLVLFTCKHFDVPTAVTFTRERFAMLETAHRAF
jgi:hypothetical protein